MIRYAITGGDRARPREALLADTRRWAEEGLEYVQLREKWMDAGELVGIAVEMMGIFAAYGGRTKLLLNGRVDVAVAAGADGVHLTAGPDELTAEQARRVLSLAERAVVSVSCHSIEEVGRARGADLILFGPVFEKRVEGEVVVAGVGLGSLREACVAASGVPILALGGVAEENARDCIEAGAAGVAGIRLFASRPGGSQ